MSKGKALYLHGFLGDPSDMRPLFLEDYDCEAFDVRSLLKEESPAVVLSQKISNYDFAVGYSFGGRLLGELKELCPEKINKWIFVSSRHTPYPAEELASRKDLRKRLFEASFDLEEFFGIWREFPLFSDHQMDQYRQDHRLAFTPWSQEEIQIYLDRFFQSKQFMPSKCKKSHYFHGLGDQKYSKEAKRLEGVFNLHAGKGGHRFLFEDPEGFKVSLLKILSSD